MRNMHKSKDFQKISVSDSSDLCPTNHSSAIEGICSCGAISEMIWVREIEFWNSENKYWCEKCHTREILERRKKDV